jgi:hypothetical protein
MKDISSGTFQLLVRPTSHLPRMSCCGAWRQSERLAAVVALVGFRHGAQPIAWESTASIIEPRSPGYPVHFFTDGCHP